MTALQVATRAAALVSAVVLQPAVVTFLGLPGGTPQLLLVIVAVIALVDGPGPGVVSGFAAGLASDLTADHLVGRQALVLCLVGYGVGLLADDERSGVLRALAIVAAATVGGLALDAGLAVVLGDSRTSGRLLGTSVVAAVLYDVLITPFVFPVLRALLVRADPERRG